MSTNTEQQISNTTVIYPQDSETFHHTLYNVEQFTCIEPAFTAAALRNLIFKAKKRCSSKGEIPGNGLIECGAIIRCGRKVMIHRERFLEWVQKK